MCAGRLQSAPQAKLRPIDAGMRSRMPRLPMLVASGAGRALRQILLVR
jgi:hypothetical protein